MIIKVISTRERVVQFSATTAEIANGIGNLDCKGYFSHHTIFQLSQINFKIFKCVSRFPVVFRLTTLTTSALSGRRRRGYGCWRTLRPGPPAVSAMPVRTYTDSLKWRGRTGERGSG